MLKIGDVYVYHTCKEIDPITKIKINEYDVYFSIEEIYKDKVKIFNLTTGRYKIYDKCFIYAMIDQNIFERLKY